jgi:hypothetical protein
MAMGRNALNATVLNPGVRVQGVVSSPSVETTAFRDQLYQAVEAVVTSPAVGSLKGIAILEGGKKQTVTAKLIPPPNAYTIPVPYSVEASYSVTSLDAQGILSGQYQLPPNSIGPAQISPGTVSPLKVVSGNITGVANQSYLLQPGASATITLPINASIGDVVKIQGDGLKVKAGTDQAITQWVFRTITAEADILAVKCSSDGKTIYVLINDGSSLYKSSDAAKTWQLLSGASENDRAGSLQCSDDGMTVLLSSETSDYKISRNGGLSWANLSNQNISEIRIAPVGNKLFGLSSDWETLFFSSNDGATWQMKTFPGQRGVSDLLFSGDGLTMAYVTEDNNGAIKCQISHDGGLSWSAKGPSQGFSVSQLNYGIQGLISRDGSKIVFFVSTDHEDGGYYTQRYVSIDSGDTWISSKSGIYMDLENLEENKPEPLGFEDGKTVLFGSKISRDQGSTWVNLPVKFTNNDEEPNYILTKAYSHDFMRRIGISYYDMETNQEGLYTSWADEVVSERGNSLQMVYLGNGIWSSLESQQPE